jgi:hypothetical protein
VGRIYLPDLSDLPDLPDNVPGTMPFQACPRKSVTMPSRRTVAPTI